MTFLNHSVDFFVLVRQYESHRDEQKAKLLVRSSLLTSLFSSSYLLLSLYYSFDKALYLMIFNALGFLLVPFLFRTRLSITWIGNIYVFIGAFAVTLLTYFSGGIWSGLYAWIIAVPILAMMVVDRYSAIVWAIACLIVMLGYGWFTHQGYDFPIEYDQSLSIGWQISVMTGLLMLIFVIALTFEYNKSEAVKQLEKRNLTLLRQKEKIALQSDELKKLLEEKDYTTNIMAHDLKNPLANIINMTTVLEAELTAEERTLFLKRIKEGAEDSMALINKILEIGKTKQSHLEVKLEEVKPQDIIAKEIDALATPIREKNIKIVLHQPPKPLTILSDKTYLQQIFQNLLSNAIKFSEPKTKVEVDFVVNEEHLFVRVIDQGPGISEEDLTQMFGRYARLSAKPTGGETSTGLGLSIVKRYAELLGGMVDCESQLGEGSIFTVKLPMTF